MKTWTAKEIGQVLTMLKRAEAGPGISDADRAYKRGWRDCLRHLRHHFNQDTGEPPAAPSSEVSQPKE